MVKKSQIDIPAALMEPPTGYADWLADLKTSSRPSIEQIERKLGNDDDSYE